MKKSGLKRACAGAVLAAAMLAGTSAQAGVLLGSVGLEKAADLTRIATATHTLQFLDLTTTQGWTLENALFAYESQGFRLATGDDMRELMGAFGLTYVITADYMAELPGTAQQSASLVDYVGATWTDAAFGMSYEAARSMLIFSCISAGSCGEPPNYVAMEDYNYGNELMGFYLVRNEAAPVPLPAPLPLIGIGLLALAALRRAACLSSNVSNCRTGTASGR